MGITVCLLLHAAYFVIEENKEKKVGLKEEKKFYFVFMAFNPEDFNSSGPRNISTALTDW